MIRMTSFNTLNLCSQDDTHVKKDSHNLDVTLKALVLTIRSIMYLRDLFFYFGSLTGRTGTS